MEAGRCISSVTVVAVGQKMHRLCSGVRMSSQLQATDVPALCVMCVCVINFLIMHAAIAAFTTMCTRAALVIFS